VRLGISSALALVALAAAPLSLDGQAAAISVVAQVSTTALSITTVADLDFQQVVPGVPTTVDPETAPTAGQFEVRGARGAEFEMTFVMPANLMNGLNAMPAAFGPGSVCVNPISLGRRNNCTLIDPAVPFIERIPNNGNPTNRRWFVWVGGTVSPTPVQSSGFYSAPITLVVTYTGN